MEIKKFNVHTDEQSYRKLAHGDKINDDLIEQVIDLQHKFNTELHEHIDFMDFLGSDENVKRSIKEWEKTFDLWKVKREFEKKHAV